MQSISSLECASAEQWDGLIESVGPAAMLLVVRARMSPALLARPGTRGRMTEDAAPRVARTRRTR
jgi:hypothetical protein